MTYSKIIGTGSYLPSQTLSNADLEKMVDTTDEWIQKRVGISNRHICTADETPSVMAFEATQKALEAAGIAADDLDMIVVGTVTGDKQFPSTACLLQEKLDTKRPIPAFDIAAACSGFIYGLNIADNFIKSGQYKTILVVGVEALTRMTDWTDRSTCVLFGDGAGVAILQASEEPGIISSSLHADGHYASSLWADNHLWTGNPQDKIHMNGGEVFKIAVNKLGSMVDDALVGTGLTKEDINWLIPHQANYRIIQAAAKKLGLPMERVILTVADQGNTSAASVPLALDYGIRQGQIKRGEVLFLEAFGAGLSWGSSIIKY